MSDSTQGSRWRSSRCSPDAPSLPTASIVIPAFNAAETIGPCVESILAQKYPHSRFEIIVVDNGSTDGTLRLLRDFGDKITVLSERRRGAAAARNAGVRHASHDFVAFTDADCVADPGWLRALIDRSVAGPETDFIGGPVRAYEPGGPIEIFSERLFDHQVALEEARWPYAITGNVLVRRTFLHQVGLFDENCLRGHDTELSYRALFNHQARFGYVADAVVYHRNPSSLWLLFVEGVKHGRGHAFILARQGRHLGITPFGRVFNRRRNQRILEMSWRGIRLSLLGGAEARRERNECFYDALFHAGRQIGTMVQATRNSLVRKS